MLSSFAFNQQKNPQTELESSQLLNVHNYCLGALLNPIVHHLSKPPINHRLTQRHKGFLGLFGFLVVVIMMVMMMIIIIIIIIIVVLFLLAL